MYFIYRFQNQWQKDQCTFYQKLKMDSIFSRLHFVPLISRWRTYQYRPCSHQCGGGVRRRRVECVQQVGDSTGEALRPMAMCPGPAPSDSMVCNVIDCPPSWDMSPWSKVRLVTSYFFSGSNFKSLLLRTTVWEWSVEWLYCIKLSNKISILVYDSWGYDWIVKGHFIKY